MGLITELTMENDYLQRQLNQFQERWKQVCKQCTHSYTTKDEPDRIKCRCRKKCKFDDKGLRGNTKNESSSRDSR